MATPAPDLDYDPYAWHDDTVYGMRFRTPDLISPHLSPDGVPLQLASGDWTSAFILDIDHIVAWVRSEDGIRFRVAPADLIFLDACDLEMAIDWGDSAGEIGVHEPAIDHIIRVALPGATPSTPSYRWRIVMNHPAGGEIVFRARGFELNLRRPPVLRDVQRLPVSGRR
ncbi:MAG: hypothetical protein O3B37_05320 [Proteobacteria bacterium]|nr:hypothetical protein [Pseudomonadota bacterium]